MRSGSPVYVRPKRLIAPSSQPTWSSFASAPNSRRSKSDLIGITLRPTDTRGSRSCPAFARPHETFGSARPGAGRREPACPREGVSSSSGACPARRPHRRSGASRTPPDPLRKAGRLRLHREHRAPGTATDIGGDYAGTGDRARNSSVFARASIGVERIAECLRPRATPAPRAAAHAQLQAPPANRVRGGGILGHVERVLVAHVDHAGADLDPARPHSDSSEQRKRRGELFERSGWTRTNAPSIPISSAATASLTVWRSAVGCAVRHPPPGCHAPKTGSRCAGMGHALSLAGADRRCG